MLMVLKKLLKKSEAAFKVDEPDIELTVSVSECLKQLKSANINYNKVCRGYVVFSANLFGGLDLMVGLHYKGAFVEYIEIFRPIEQYNLPDYDINKSFSEIHDAIVSVYGKPSAEKPKYADGFPSERWIGRNYVIDHYVFDRFGPEEHTHFIFAHP